MADGTALNNNSCQEARRSADRPAAEPPSACHCPRPSLQPSGPGRL